MIRRCYTRVSSRTLLGLSAFIVTTVTVYIILWKRNILTVSDEGRLEMDGVFQMDLTDAMNKKHLSKLCDQFFNLESDGGDMDQSEVKSLPLPGTHVSARRRYLIYLCDKLNNIDKSNTDYS